MAAIGVFSDSEGDLERFDQALRVLTQKGATRFLFAGGRYDDLDAWVRWKREQAKAATDYSTANFLEDVERWLVGLEQMERPAAFGTAYEASRTADALARLANRVVRTPERGSLSFEDPSVPRKVVDMLGDTLCCLVHDKNDLGKEDMVNAAVLVHGKEPDAKVVPIGPRTFVTPGRLVGGSVATVGLLGQVDGKGLVFSAFTLDGAPAIESQVLAVGAKNKVSVK
jgi:hypothetical protein